MVSGHGLSGNDQAVVDSKVHAPVGSVLELGGHPYDVVGVVDGRTMDGGIPLVYMPLATVQRAVTGGRPLITAVATTGTPANVPAGLVVLTPSAVVTDTVTALGSAVTSIDNTRSLMWLIAAAIVASMLYVAALERKRDFAVLKALGSSSGALFLSLVLEAVVVTLLAAILAEILSLFMAPLFAQPIDITPDARTRAAADRGHGRRDRQHLGVAPGDRRRPRDGFRMNDDLLVQDLTSPSTRGAT